MIEVARMTPVLIVIDTNVMVTAYRSSKGASYALLSRLHEGSFKACLSNALVLQYEEKLKAEEKRMGRGTSRSVDRFLDYLLSKSNRCSVLDTLVVEGIHQDDQFVFDLAVASEARIIVTYNIKHFSGAGACGISVVRPGQFLRLLEKTR